MVPTVCRTSRHSFCRFLPGLTWLHWCILSMLPLIFIDRGVSHAQLDRLRKSRPPDAMPVPDVPMASVPAGTFLMGADGSEALEDERPAHHVWLDGFSIDLYEVSTAQYSAFLATTQRTVPWQWESVNPSRHGDKPVIGVDWSDADAYCRWRGKMLPTEAQWEKAARGQDNRLYPWGNQVPNSDLANFALGARFSYDLVLIAVGSYDSGKSPYGVHQMAGNVYEWVQDWYGANYYESSPDRNPAGPDHGQFKVLRGGSWSDLPKYLLTYGRFKLPPETRNSYTGFRCAKALNDPQGGP